MLLVDVLLFELVVLFLFVSTVFELVVLFFVVVLFVVSSLLSVSSLEPYSSSINFAVSFLSATKNHNGYDGVVDGPNEPPGKTALWILFISMFIAYGI